MNTTIEHKHPIGTKLRKGCQYHPFRGIVGEEYEVVALRIDAIGNLYELMSLASYEYVRVSVRYVDDMFTRVEVIEGARGGGTGAAS